MSTKRAERVTEEEVLVVPKRLTKSAYQLLVDCEAVPRPWHLEGRYGSRTHRIDDLCMGLPLSRSVDLTTFDCLQEVLKEPLVRVVKKAFVPSKRAREPPSVDARLHAEKTPVGFNLASTIQSTIKAKNPTEKSFTYAELFAGIGGFGVALEALGGECVFCSEWEESCQATYRLNFPGIEIHGDIRAVTDEDLPGQLDLLVGGFPCQPFSTLGKQPGLACEKQGQLIYEVARVLKKSKPAAFLLENVPGLQAMTETFDIVLQVLRDSGYTVTTEVCSSRGLTATNRKRIFFVGFRNREEDGKKGDSGFAFPFVPDLKLRASHVLDYDEMDDRELETLRLASKTMNQLRTGGRWRPASMAWPNNVCDTLIGHYGVAVGRGESQLVPCCAPFPPRRFSPRECARLMGFPSTFQFVPRRPDQGGMAYCKEQYRMFGNAVCPPLIAVLSGALLARVNPDKDWTKIGLDTSVRLALAATRPGPSRSISIASVPESFFIETVERLGKEMDPDPPLCSNGTGFEMDRVARKREREVSQEE